MPHYPNSIRCKKYNRAILPAEYSALENLITINPNKTSVRAGARVTMEALVDALLPHGLIPLVVPEFKGITVGGAINGAAIESTSGIYGQFNDTCLSYTLWTGREKIHVSPNEHADLFYGVAGSYGSLGRIIDAEISVVPTTGCVELEYETFQSSKEACEGISLSQEPIEGIVYDINRTVLIRSKPISPSAAKNLQAFDGSQSSSEWFFAHIDRISKKQSKGSFVMPVRDYLFRHDRGAFWMAGLGARMHILIRYALHKLFGWDGGYLPSTTPAHPSYFTRALFGHFCDSQRLYQSLHNGSEPFFKERVLIQDFYIPLKQTPAFTEQVINLYHIRPLWLCPVKPTPSEQLFSPHYSTQSNLLIDVGVYGIPYKRDAISATKDLEQLTSAFGGRKMLYSYNFYSPDDFWMIYPKTSYEALRKKYQLHELLDITAKVL
jgi:delta24-sterol reductase